MRQLAEQISTAMEAQNVSQTELSRRTNIDRTTLNKALRGKVSLSLAQVSSISQALGVSLSGSGANSDLYPSLEAFLAENSRDITPREREFLEGARFQSRPPERQEFWAAILAAYRASR